MRVSAVLKEKLESLRHLVEQGISTLLPSPNTRPERLHQAIHYSMNAGGKRIRPALLLLSSEIFDSEGDPLPAAIAVECLHTYTLIHDDLPSIDNSDLRRGKPSCHKAFDEATALLAGDSLLTYAFEILSGHYAYHPELALELVKDLSTASGSQKLIGGQMEDIDSEGQAIAPATLAFIHENKTAALITAALTMGLRFGDTTEGQISLMKNVGFHIGMNFQIVDDILDATSSAEEMGKPVGSDAKAQKSTYVAMHGIEGARKRARVHAASAISALEEIGGRNESLIDFVTHLNSRVN